MTSISTPSISTPSIQLPIAISNEIIAHARAGKPEEICGILRGRGLVATQLIQGRNIADERIENYEVDPQTLLRQFEFEDAGDEMMGIYHSHPVSVAYPSATDAWNAHYPESIYFICSLEFDDAPVIRAFRMTPHYLELDLPALAQSLPFYETRPGLFGYFVDSAAEAEQLAERWGTTVPAPFYIVYHHPEADRPDTLREEGEGRVVSIVEHAIDLV